MSDSLWWQTTMRLRPRARGIHLITDDIRAALPELPRVGLLHIFIQHSSASLAINENADADVRADMRRWLDHHVPEDEPYFVHTYEGPDDMPAHIKTVLTGVDLTIPVADGRLALGTWQGIYLCEHRDQGGSRSLVLTLSGQKAK